MMPEGRRVWCCGECDDEHHTEEEADLCCTWPCAAAGCDMRLEMGDGKSVTLYFGPVRIRVRLCDRCHAKGRKGKETKQ